MENVSVITDLPAQIVMNMIAQINVVNMVPARILRVFVMMTGKVSTVASQNAKKHA
jgi:hypothetical protein